MDKAVPVLTNEITKKVSKEGAKGQQKGWKIEKFIIKAVGMSDSCSLYLVSDGSLWVEKHVYKDIL